MKCLCRPKESIYCTNEVIAKLKVKVQHEDTGRITFQTWYYCAEHLAMIEQDQGIGWFRWYNHKPARAIVLSYYVELLIYNHLGSKLNL